MDCETSPPDTQVGNYTSNKRLDTTARSQATDERFKLLSERLKTYDNWPVTFLQPSRLAEAGFYYFNRNDLVRCPYCKIEIGKWQQGDDPMRDHQRWSPNCSFVKFGNVPSSPEDGSSTSSSSSRGYDTCGPYGIEIRPFSGPESGLRSDRSLEETIGIHKASGPQHKDYSTYDARLRSYKFWPTSLRQKPHALSEAGFFYTGTGDQTVCFHCGGGLKDWEDNDDPWEEHALWFSKCMFVYLVKGKPFIDHVRAKKEAKLTCKEAQELETPKAETSQEVEPKEEPATSTSTMETKKPNEHGKVDDARLCKICFTNELGVLFLPCGHIVACVHCAPSLDTCAVCRQPFSATVRAYVP